MPFSIHMLSLQSHQLVFLHHLNRESAIVSAPRFLWIIPQRCWNWKKNGKPKHTIPHRRVFLTTRRAPFSFETALNTNHARRDSHLVEPSFVPPKDRRLLPTWKQLPVIVSRSSLPVQSLSNNNSWQEKPSSFDKSSLPYYPSYCYLLLLPFDDRPSCASEHTQRMACLPMKGSSKVNRRHLHQHT